MTREPAFDRDHALREFVKSIACYPFEPESPQQAVMILANIRERAWSLVYGGPDFRHDEGTIPLDEAEQPSLRLLPPGGPS